MKSLLIALASLALLTFNSQISTAHAQGTAFSYQGRLNTNGAPANGSYDFRFRLFFDPLGNTQAGSTLLTNAIPVTNGLFITTMDFGTGIFTGSNYWLELDVRTNGNGGYSDLMPLQAVTPTPYAIFATTASNVSGTVSAAQLSGAVVNANLPSSPSVSGTVSAGSFSGNGANVTNVNAAALNGLTSASFWQTNGNAGTSPTNGAFLGTTDNQPLELHVNGGRALRLEPGLIGQGAPNVIGGSPINFVAGGIYGATIGGGGATNGAYSNSVTGSFGTVSGGENNTASGYYEPTVGGGYGNTASDDDATVGGGEGNTASGFGATVGGGERNNASEAGATVGGGGYDGVDYGGNTASGEASTVGGGLGNTANDIYGTVGGGFRNTAAEVGTVPGGFENEADGEFSFAAGERAQALHQGAFVWADSEGGIFASTTNDQFLIRAQGGVGIDKTNPATALDVNGTVTAANFVTGGYIGVGTTNPIEQLDVLASQAVGRFFSTNNGNGSVIELRNSTSGTTSLGAINFNNSASTYPGQIAYSSGNVMSFRVAGNNNMMLLSSSELTVNGTFVSSSDRNMKQDFQPVDSLSVLQKVLQLPVQTWAYKSDPGTKHLGPMAQDFYAAFGTGADDKHIAVVDEGGVALAAIQGLNEKLNEKDAKINELENRLNQLEQTLQTLTNKTPIAQHER